MDEEVKGWWSNRSPLGAVLRVLFGLIWVVDGAMKFALIVPADVTNLVQGAGQG